MVDTDSIERLCQRQEAVPMDTKALLVRLEAKPGQEQAVAEFLRGGR